MLVIMAVWKPSVSRSLLRELNSHLGQTLRLLLAEVDVDMTEYELSHEPEDDNKDHTSDEASHRHYVGRGYTVVIVT